MKKKINIAFLFGFAIGVAAWGLWWIHQEDLRQEQEYILLMESQDDFDGETVDRLWHFKNEHNCSTNFMDLYERKIKPLPGWRP